MKTCTQTVPPWQSNTAFCMPLVEQMSRWDLIHKFTSITYNNIATISPFETKVRCLVLAPYTYKRCGLISGVQKQYMLKNSRVNISRVSEMIEIHGRLATITPFEVQLRFSGGSISLPKRRLIKTFEHDPNDKRIIKDIERWEGILRRYLW